MIGCFDNTLSESVCVTLLSAMLSWSDIVSQNIHFFKQSLTGLHLNYITEKSFIFGKTRYLTKHHKIRKKTNVLKCPAPKRLKLKG